jgi:hypothetical protein
VSGRSLSLAVLGGWSFVAAMVVALLVGGLMNRGYLQVLGIVVVEALLLWVYSLGRLQWS